MVGGDERVEEVHAAGQEHVDEDGRIRRRGGLGLRGGEHVVLRQGARGVHRDGRAEAELQQPAAGDGSIEQAAPGRVGVAAAAAGRDVRAGGHQQSWASGPESRR